MKPSLLPHLRCPVTGEPLRLEEPVTAAGSDEIVSGRLASASGRSYEVEGGVPVLLDTAAFAPGQAETRASFSEKWRMAPDYRERTRPHYERWYLERYGHGDLAGLRRLLAGKQRILDAGTGHGRDTEMYARNSDATVVGIDLSEGIRLAYRDLASVPNVHLVQADLRHLPFPEGHFDLVACDQVIHHTPDTRASLAALLTRVAPGGHIAFYVYKVKGPIREFADDWIRERTTRMSPEECLAFSEAMTHLGKVLSDLHATIDLPQAIPLLGIPAGKHDVQRLVYWHVMKCYWNDTIDWDSNVITNFDWYHPLHAHRHTEAEVRTWCTELGIAIEHLSVVESGISVLGRRA